MNKKGNIMVNFLLFIMALGVMIAFVSPMASFLELAQGSNYMNCNGYIHESATTNQNYTYDSAKNSDTLGCLSLKLYLPYILLVFLVGSIGKLLYDQSNFFGGGSQENY